MTRFPRIASLALAAAVATAMAVATAPVSAAAKKKATATQVTQIGPKGSRALSGTEVVASGKTLFFTASGEGGGKDLYRIAGGKAVKVANPALADGDFWARPTGLTDVGGTLYYFSRASNLNYTDYQLFTVRGSGAPALVTTLAMPDEGLADSGHVAAGGKLYFIGHGDTSGGELWVSDGTAKGTRMLKDIRRGLDASGISDLTAVGKKVFFTADDGKHGQELWVSDGTAKGTTLVKDTYRGTYTVRPTQLTAAGTKLYFIAYGADDQRRLWVSNGTAKGTKPVLGAKAKTALQPYIVGAAGKTLYFTALPKGVSVNTLWKSKGTKKSTKVVKRDVSGEQGVRLGKKLIFVGKDSRHDRQPWVSNGKAKGTAMLKEVADGGLLGSVHVTAAGSWAYFVAPFWKKRKNTVTSTYQIWRTNGTKTQRVTDFTEGFNPDNLAAVGNTLYFTVGEPGRSGGDMDIQLWSITG